MNSVPCAGCSTFFIPRNKCQKFCSRPDCQRLRKALWQKQKLATDLEYKEGQRLAQKKWLQNNPDYWQNYRRKNPEKIDRNKSLQRIRNIKKRKNKSTYGVLKSTDIAKMDSRRVRGDNLFGQYWLVPAIAKMDVVKVFIASVSGNSP